MWVIANSEDRQVPRMHCVAVSNRYHNNDDERDANQDDGNDEIN